MQPKSLEALEFEARTMVEGLGLDRDECIHELIAAQEIYDAAVAAWLDIKNRLDAVRNAQKENSVVVTMPRKTGQRRATLQD